MEFQDYWLLVLVVMTRTAAFVLMLPFLRNRSIPVMAKAAIVIILSAFIAQKLDPIDVDSFLEFAPILIEQVIIGFILAFMIELMFSIVRIGGALVDMDIGLAKPFPDGSINDQSTVLSKIFYYVFLMIFLVLGGFEKVISGFVYTFKLDIKPNFLGDESFIEYIIETFNYMFFGALQIAIPFMMSTFLVYVALLLMSKSVDKINILMNIFGVKILLGLTMVTLCVPVLMTVFQQVDGSLNEHFRQTLELMFTKG